MSDLFQPIAPQQLFKWVFEELEARDSIFGVPRRHFFVPGSTDAFRTTAFGHPLETPFGPASGPHTQMAQNIVVAWLCGARYIELKTVQTIDELNVSKPCIDMEDEGYNVEWSQELKVHQSFDEYLRAWVLIHALHRKLGFPGETPGVVFNLSVGYDLAGIQKPNIQWFLDQAQDCAEFKQALLEQITVFYPGMADVAVPDRMSDSVTLSTMHGCPPGEIGSICEYLLKERGLHTFVKCNPTLLGPERVRGILHEDLGYGDVTVPDEAFGHDLEYADAVPLLQGLQKTAAGAGLDFGVKLTNTLEVENHRTVFDGSEKMMYLSGRPLHAISVNLAQELAETFEGGLPMSFCAGIDCFNAPHMLASGMQTITVCSDLLKTGGYLRMLQYLENTRDAFDKAGADSLDEFIIKTTGSDSFSGGTAAAARFNLARYAAETRSEHLLKKGSFHTSHSKTRRELDLFDCIEAPCTDQCPVNQDVPRYMQAVREGDLEKAAGITLQDNPLPAMLGRVCDHLCEPVCVRTHLDEPLAIRQIKRFIMDQRENPATAAIAQPDGPKVAIIGAGPGGMAAARELAQAGLQVEIFEKHAYAGGMVGGAIPEYRLPGEVIAQDLAQLHRLGVKIHYECEAGRDFRLADLRADGFENVAIMVGAQLGKKLGLAGEDADGVMDALHFLRQAREGRPVPVGPRIGIIGAGDTAMDCARTAWRLAPGESRVSVIYRRSIDQMPADREEVACLLQEGIDVVEMARPQALLSTDGRLTGMVCRRMEYRGDRDASGRKVPHEIPGSDFEVPLDTLILAISQHAVLDFFDGEPINLNPWGYIDADPETFETSLPGVFAGGDVVNDGPSSIVEAAADGKAIAQSILHHRSNGSTPPSVAAFDTDDLLLRRSRREWRVPVPHSPLADRKNFGEVVYGYSEEQARKEAARCLDCHRYCSLCVSVCPNLALQTWRSDPFEVQLPSLGWDAGRITTGPGKIFRAAQAFQIAVLADFCNECGNCVTFCPTAGEPYRDKPRLYADRLEFEAAQDNAFTWWREANGKPVMEARWRGKTHRIELAEKLEYRGPEFHASIDMAGFRLRNIEPAPGVTGSEQLTLQPCATMYVLLKGLAASLPYLPAAAGDGKGCIPAPAFEEQE
ncbi:MAG: FAD-dependent oxidoreductase [Xanthomonadales bacterium]|jgi:putative selenate reductase|nr:FAD-dependent oxidoreductase [Xanthomonadales bacterium]